MEKHITRIKSLQGRENNIDSETGLSHIFVKNKISASSYRAFRSARPITLQRIGAICTLCRLRELQFRVRGLFAYR